MADVDSTFRLAAEDWLASRSRQISERTKLEYRVYIGMLNRTFGDMPLRDIRLRHIQTYQQERLKKAGAACINHECNIFAQILDRFGLWNAIKPNYRRIRIQRQPRPPAASNFGHKDETLVDPVEAVDEMNPPVPTHDPDFRKLVQELYELLENYGPHWYTQELHDRMLAALTTAEVKRPKAS